MQWTSSVLSEPLFLLSVFRTTASALISSHEYTIKRPLKSIVITDYTECLWFCHLSWKGGSGARCQGFISPIWLAHTGDPLATVTGNAATFSFVTDFHLISCNAIRSCKRPILYFPISFLPSFCKTVQMTMPAARIRGGIAPLWQG